MDRLSLEAPGSDSSVSVLDGLYLRKSRLLGALCLWSCSRRWSLHPKDGNWKPGVRR